MKKCAYCGRQVALTKEHIWPKNLISRNEMTHAYNPKTGKLYQSEPVIRDVCEPCNSIKLSKLDNYLAEEFEKTFANIVQRGSGVEFEYSYQQLLRVILKISYNASRAANNLKNTSTLARFSNYVLDGGYAPRAMLRLQIITPGRRVELAGKELDEVVPKLFRSAVIAYNGRLGNRFLVKLVAINSFWFYLAVSHRNEPDHIWREFAEGMNDWTIPLGIPLIDSDRKLVIPREQTTWFDPTGLFQGRGAGGDAARADVGV
jgi:hypothetical protein